MYNVEIYNVDYRIYDYLNHACLENQQTGHNSIYMHCYDRLPKQARLLLASSDYNICAACVHEIGQQFCRGDYTKAVYLMEEKLKRLNYGTNNNNAILMPL